MILDGGKSRDGRVILRPETVRAMISPGDTPKGQKRGLGWDIETAYSAPRGRVFGPESFGHTGFTGTSLWIDPKTQTFVVILTNRVHPDGKSPSPGGLRGEIATIVGRAIVDPSRPASAPPNPEARPNLLILIGDDHAGGTLGIDGDPRRATPRLDALARDGVRFDRAYCNSPLCTPSRQSLITGKLPHVVGVTKLTTPLPDSTRTLGHVLAEAGYDTGAIGKMHFNNAGHHGFALRLDSADWLADLRRFDPHRAAALRPFRPFQDPASTWLNADVQPVALRSTEMEASFFADHAAEFLAKPRDRPFGLVVSFNEPHSPFRFPTDSPRKYDPGEFSAPPMTEADVRDRPAVFEGLTEAQVRGVQAAYYSSVAFLDSRIGQVLDALAASGRADSTIVVYVGDNGYMRGHHGRFEKHCFFEPAIRVPLIVRWPGHLPRDRAISGMVETIDVSPTLLELVGLPVPDDLQGRSLVSLMKAEPGASGRDLVFSEYFENEEAMVRDVRYKLIVGRGKHVRTDGYAPKRPPSGPYEVLFDTQDDPGETRDVSADPSRKPVVDRLKTALLEQLLIGRPNLARVVREMPVDGALQKALEAPDR